MSAPREPRAPASSNVRTRSFGGCATCRRRHVKCDQRQPECSMCICNGLRCEGYVKNIFFDSEHAVSNDIVRFRRPLFTETERQCMSELLTGSVAPGTALKLLSQIDDESENATVFQDFSVYHGPFGVFRLSQDLSPLANDPLSDVSDDTSPTQDLDYINNDFLAPLDDTMSPWTRDLVQSIFEQSDQILTTPNSSLFNVPVNQGRIQEISEAFSILDDQELLTTQLVLGEFHDPQFSQSALQDQTPTPIPFSHFHNVNVNTVPQDSVLLLRHYATTVISSLTPFQHTKTLWHTLFLPSAKSCLAALTLGEEVEHANLSIFHGTLAISAFSLGVTSRSQMWLRQGKIYEHQARENTRLMLQTAYDIPKTTKYKNVLLALTTMAQVSIFAGNKGQAENYLLETEKFIRLRGLKRRKSRKVRLLHHCYVYMRVFHESTLICDMNLKQRRLVREAVESSGLEVYDQDGLSFRLMGWKDLDSEMMVEKSQEQGENDLHLGRPGTFRATLYPEIYGIPEPWFYLFSQVIRLGNEKDAAEYDGAAEAPTLKDFFSRAKAIERCIGQLQSSNLSKNDLSGQGPGDRNTKRDILDVMQTALSIYFYRRIYNMSSSLLQEKVVNVRDWLLRNEAAEPNGAYGSIGLIWPAFIAACEAKDRGVQRSFSVWFKTAAERSGLPCFAETLNSVEQVWQEQDAASAASVTWVDVMKQNAMLRQNVQ